MSIKAVSWAMETDCPSPLSKLVLMVLCEAHNGHTNECYPTLKRVIASTGLSESSVKRYIRELEAAGKLRREIKEAEDHRTLGVRYHLSMSGSARGEGAADEPLGGPQRTGGGSLLDPANNTGKIPERREANASLPRSCFQELYDAYDKKTQRPAAEAAYLKALKKTDHETMVAAAKLWHDAVEQKYRPYLARWLGQEMWNDQPPVQSERRMNNVERNGTALRTTYEKYFGQGRPAIGLPNQGGGGGYGIDHALGLPAPRRGEP